MSGYKLTDQQQAIVNHTKGPALVFAVAGAGKTTCMVHRIKHLIESGAARPEEILATTFNTTAAQEIKGQLQRLNVMGKVDCCTLHAFGLRIIRLAVKRGILSNTWLRSMRGEDISSELVSRALTRICIEDGVDQTELGVDWEEVKNQISIWKGNLVYANLENAALTEEALKIASEAEHDNEIFLRAFRIFEELRIKQHIITFDDMLRTGWELLACDDDLRTSIQMNYRFVMVDEFQDVNLAQYSMVDLIARPHRNYMAIGDDDQCIYEWRGAQPKFILEFEKEYNAQVYKITDNFRSTAQQIIPANQVIAHNQNRFSKHLSLTQGFSGATTVHYDKGELKCARRLVSEVVRLLESGTSVNDLIVLIRLYSQTAFLETTFIEENIPYRIIGGVPFYRRQELVTLFQYLSFAQYEEDILDGNFPEGVHLKKYLNIFEAILHRPRRYVPRDFGKQATLVAARDKKSLLETILDLSDELKAGSAKNIKRFIEVINNLIPRLHRPANKALRWLVDEIEYHDYLLAISGIHELGVTRIHNVDALIEFAKTRGNSRQFLDYIRTISTKTQLEQDANKCVKLMTIYRAKGLEWDTVFVPGCNDGIIPCATAESEPGAEVVTDEESERRLFYVAITRARRTLHLYVNQDLATSRFINESDFENVLSQLSLLSRFVDGKQALDRTKTIIEIATLITEFKLERYFSKWMNKSSKNHRAKSTMASLRKKIERAIASKQKYELSLEEYRQTQQQYLDREKHRKEQLRKTPILIRKYKSASSTTGIDSEVGFDRFEDGNIMVVSEKGMFGVVEHDRMEGFEHECLEWQSCKAQIKKKRESMLYEAVFTQASFVESHPAFEIPAAKAPSRPPAKQMALADPAFVKSVNMLEKLVGNTK